jgi:hypothetical protein
MIDLLFFKPKYIFKYLTGLVTVQGAVHANKVVLY